MSDALAAKRRKEKKTVRTMIGIYCRGQKHPSAGKNELCADCQALWDYAEARVERCPKMAEKTFCSCCEVHCYKPDMQQKIKAVMRYAGPRMLFVQPIDAVRHVILMLKFKRAQKKKAQN